tara:strand:- start:4987 stop:5541 length:555 start_codon:yes stop_codon:yes gene_type:complete
VNKKDNILASALKLLTENGVHATPMSAIAKEAGTGMGTIYNYYPTKEVLINDIYTDIKLKEEKLFTNFPSELPVKTKFETFYKVTVEFFIQNPSYFSFMDQLNSSPIISEESKAIGQRAIENVLQLIEDGKKDRIIKDIKTNELVQFIGGSLMSYIRWSLTQNNPTNKATLANQLKMVWDAIKE